MGAMQRLKRRLLPTNLRCDEVQMPDFDSSLALEMKTVWAILAQAFRIINSVICTVVCRKASLFLFLILC